MSKPTAGTWPTTAAEFQQLADCLLDLVGGRRDCVARHYDFEKEGKKIKGWGPWKARRVDQDYEPRPDEHVRWIKTYDKKGIERWLMRQLSRDTMVLHLRGRERLGVYTLDEQSLCKFIAVDFDDHEGKLKPEEVLRQARRLIQHCEVQGFVAHLERSKSLRGYHVWMFFDEPVRAALLRGLGRWLLVEAGVIDGEEDFSTYDRLFPMQAMATPPDLGSLIGLPLCGGVPYAEGRCAWVDDQGAVIKDAVKHTLWIRDQGRNPVEKLMRFLEDWAVKPEESAVTPKRETRDPDMALGAQKEFDACVTRCAFLQHASAPENAAQLVEPLWYSMITNACRFKVDDWIHKASEPHSGYSASETEAKIAQARTATGPHKCSTIQDHGFGGCPRGGCKLPNGKATLSPAGLSAWANPPRREQAPAQGEGGSSSPPAPAAEAEARALWPKDTPMHPDTKLPWPQMYGGFELSIAGIHIMRGKSSELVALRPMWVDALTEGTVGGEDGLVIKFFNRRWRLRRQAIPVELLHEQGGVLAKVLAPQGAIILPGKEKWVARFFSEQMARSTQFIQATSRLGWLRSTTGRLVFVLPDHVIGAPESEIVYQSDIPPAYAESMRMEGSLKDWQDHVASPCLGNPMMMFAAMIGLAGPLLRPCDEQGGGFHYYGTTTGGKTTCGQLAMTAWGNGADPANDSESTAIRTWDVTTNALEGIAELHSHQVLVMDEIGKASLEDVGRAIYKLAGGKGKERATISGGLRRPRSWRTMIVSNGEMSLQQIALKNKQALKGGQMLRIVDIPADTDKGDRGIVLDSHSKDPKLFVEDIKTACARYYGTAGPAFVAYLLGEYEKQGVSVVVGLMKEELRKIEQYLAKHLAGEIPPEGRRVLRRFALVALAGCRSGPKCAGVLPYTVEQVLDVTLKVATRWLDSVGSARSETQRGVAKLRDSILANVNSFVWANAEKPPNIREVLGYRSGDYFLVLPAAFVQFCGDYDANQVAAKLRELDLLKAEDGRLQHKTPVIASLGKFRPRVYWVSGKLIGDDTPDEREPGSDDDSGAVRPAQGKWWDN